MNKEMYNMKPTSAALSPSDKAILETLDDVTLLNIAAVLYDARWPKELPEPETSGYSRKRFFIEQWLKDKLGQKAVVRVWHNWMEDEEFELFYAACWLHEPEAELKYDELERKKLVARITTPDHFGRLFSYYHELRVHKAKALGIADVESICSFGYWKRELFNSSEWISLYDESYAGAGTDEILDFFRRHEMEVIDTEYFPNEFRVWVKFPHAQDKNIQ